MTILTCEATAQEEDYNAFDIMLDRGSMLRKLRELEVEDEKLRQAASLEEEEFDEDEESGNKDTLLYDTYLRRQKCYDDFKHVNYRYLDFGNVGTDGKLLIEQDRGISKMSKGGQVWDAGVILAEHIIHEQAEWKKLQSKSPVKMVELGAGTGITGLYVAKVMKDDVHVAITDLPELVPLMEKNIQHNQLASNVTAFPLAWGSNVADNYDVILGADVVAGIYCPKKLAQTICDLCHENTIVYMTVNCRLTEIIDTFESAMTELFENFEKRAPVSRNKNPTVSILVASRKR